ncbi:MAG: hypothetical protein CVV44_00565 [Spirochaetae bacterium HGW-Spirochaetae-1]|jgi:hypothetical protein|nr:MAG: hypothetical protein CVV44_00565 [Spirochaetae bacterium HGW-Spirochaetae-1]
MQPEIAIIKSSDKPYSHDKKLGGLYLLERNINVLLKAGIPMIYLDLNEEEKAFYNNKISRHIRSAGRVAMLENTRLSTKKTVLIVPSNLFFQAHYLNTVETYFQQRKNQLTPLIKGDQFLIFNLNDIRNAEQLVSQFIISNTGGFIAQKIYKRISIPISLKVAGIRIHPGYFSVLNMFIGLMSSVFMMLAADRSSESSYRYFMMAMAGIFFQTSSVFDGVNDEVSKFTFNFSKTGDWIETIGNNLTLLFFLISSSYLNYSYLGGTVSLASIIVMFASLAVFLPFMVRYVRKYNETGFLTAFDKHFLQLLPDEDFLARFAKSMTSMIKKESFSLIFCLIAIAGMAEIIIPLASFVILISAMVSAILYWRYKDTVKG